MRKCNDSHLVTICLVRVTPGMLLPSDLAMLYNYNYNTQCHRRSKKTFEIYLKTLNIHFNTNVLTKKHRANVECMLLQRHAKMNNKKLLLF